MTPDILSAFFIGLLGSGHCIGMCGGITSMLTSAIPQSKSRVFFVLNYHFGRIFSYALIGAIVGFSGSVAAKNIGLPLSYLRLFAGIFIVLLGLYIGQWFMGIQKIESYGKYLWRYLSPLSKKVIPVDSAPKALSLGLIWGWLPCGLVYSTLTWALASNSAVSGAAIMISFGLGTLPALLTVTFGVFQIKNLLTNQRFRKATAFLIILYGIYVIIFASRQLF